MEGRGRTVVWLFGYVVNVPSYALQFRYTSLRFGQEGCSSFCVGRGLLRVSLRSGLRNKAYWLFRRRYKSPVSQFCPSPAEPRGCPEEPREAEVLPSRAGREQMHESSP